MFNDPNAYYKYMNGHKYACREDSRGATTCMAGNRINGSLNNIGDTTEVKKIFDIDCDGTAFIKGSVTLFGDYTNAGHMSIPKGENVVYIDGLVIKKGGSLDIEVDGPQGLIKIIKMTNENGGSKGVNFVAKNGA